MNADRVMFDATDAEQRMVTAEQAAMQAGRSHPGCHECLVINYLRVIATALCAIANQLEGKPQ